MNILKWQLNSTIYCKPIEKCPLIWQRLQGSIPQNIAEAITDNLVAHKLLKYNGLWINIADRIIKYDLTEINNLFY